MSLTCRKTWIVRIAGVRNGLSSSTIQIVSACLFPLPNHLSTLPTTYIAGNSIEQQNFHRDLGIILQENLKWDHHAL